MDRKPIKGGDLLCYGILLYFPLSIKKSCIFHLIPKQPNSLSTPFFSKPNWVVIYQFAQITGLSYWHQVNLYISLHISTLFSLQFTKQSMWGGDWYNHTKYKNNLFDGWATLVGYQSAMFVIVLYPYLLLSGFPHPSQNEIPYIFPTYSWLDNPYSLPILHEIVWNIFTYREYFKTILVLSVVK